MQFITCRCCTLSLLSALFTCRCGHTLLLAHAKAVQLYRLKYQQSQEGRISMVISAHWGLPFDSSSKAGGPPASSNAHAAVPPAWTTVAALPASALLCFGHK